MISRFFFILYIQAWDGQGDLSIIEVPSCPPREETKASLDELVRMKELRTYSFNCLMVPTPQRT
jgi:hypothetical protein